MTKIKKIKPATSNHNEETIENLMISFAQIAGRLFDHRQCPDYVRRTLAEFEAAQKVVTSNRRVQLFRKLLSSWLGVAPEPERKMGSYRSEMRGVC